MWATRAVDYKHQAYLDNLWADLNELCTCNYGPGGEYGPME